MMSAVLLAFGGSHTVLTQCAPLTVATHLITLNKGKVITSHDKGTRKYIRVLQYTLYLYK